jgi:hypothetical protein
LKAVRERKTPSAMVERQILPRQTKRTETFLGEGSVIVVVVLEGLVVVVRAGECLWKVSGNRIGSGIACARR